MRHHLVVAIVSVELLVHCSVAPPAVVPAEPAVPPAAAPVWTTRESGPYTLAGTLMLYGVGSAEGIRGIALARTTAANRARAEIAKYFLALESSLVRDGMAAGAIEPCEAPESCEDCCTKSLLSPQPLAQAVIVAEWLGANRTAYALAQLDLGATLLALATLPDTAAGVREFLTNRGAAAVTDWADREFAAQRVTLIDEALLPLDGTGACGVTLALAPDDQSRAVLDASVANLQGVVVYPCGGGDAVAAFGPTRYRGTYLDGTLHLRRTIDTRWHDCAARFDFLIDGDPTRGVVTFNQQELDGCATMREASALLSATPRELPAAAR